MKSRMKSNFGIIALALLFIFAGSTAADQIEDDLTQALLDISNKHHEPLTLSFDTFTYEDSGISGPFSRFLEDKLTAAISDCDPYCSLFVHNALQSMDLTFKETFGEHISARGVKHVIRGKYFDIGTDVSVRFQVIDFTTGYLIGSETIEIPKRLIPSYADFVPKNYSSQVKIMQDLRSVLDSNQSDFKIRATTTRGNGGAYKNGEEFVITVASTHNCYIKIYHFNTAGDMKLIFPEPGYSNFIEANKPYFIPNSHYPLQFIVEPPFGGESLKIIASTKQFDEIEQTFVPLANQGDKREFIAMELGGYKRAGQGISTSAESLYAEAYVTYTTMP